MNLKKSDKLIAILGVVILVVAAIGIYFYSVEETTVDEPEPDMDTYSIFWEKNSDSMTVEGDARPEDSGSFSLRVPNDAVLTKVDIRIEWEDDRGLGVKIPLIPQLRGKDTLDATITDPDNQKREHTSTGGTVNETIGSFNINSPPPEESHNVKNQDELITLLFDMYNFDTTFYYEVTVDAKGLFDKGNAYTFVIEYEYAQYILEEN